MKNSLLVFLLLPFALLSQKPAKPSAADLHQAIKKLNVLGSVLYVAAHPDDENQRFISYCANHKLFNVTYLSLTRGDGGQNLIGPEIRELLGVLRTEELLAARAIDGGKQMFSRANDFGFSKNPDETLRIWDKDAVLADVVWAIRQTQPDVVVNRFFHEKKYETHGHHTASGMLSVEAFDLAGKKEAYPEQLNYVQPWQPRRVLFNTSWFFFGGQEAFAKMDKSNLFSLDLGVYLPLKGKGNNEVAAEARSMHRCQGFGSMSTRGENLEYFDFIKGEKPTERDMFQGINTTWTRVQGGGPIGTLLAKIDEKYRSDNPAASVPDLLKVLKMIQVLPDGHWKRLKLVEIQEVIRGCLGLYLEATATEPTASPGQQVKLVLECINRSAVPVTLDRVSILPGLYDTMPAQALTNNKIWFVQQILRLPANAPFTAPYWLQTEAGNGMYNVPDQQMRGLPETPRYLKVRWSLKVDGVPMEYETGAAYKIEESAIGEVWRPFEVLPPAFVEFDQPSYLFNTPERSITLRVKAGRDSLRGKVQLAAPAGWEVTPPASGTAFDFAKQGQEQDFVFKVAHRGGGSADVMLVAQTVIGGVTAPAQRLISIRYEHIPQQSVLQPAQVRAVSAEVQATAKNIGYYAGAGDDVPAALRQMGCTVTMLEDKDFTAEKLRQFDAVLLGIRAYNTRAQLAFHQAKLFEYVEQGGTLVTQYNTNFDWVVEPNKVAPFSLRLSRTRVTDEGSDVRVLLPDHPVLNAPNKIGTADFNGWVQERGLYFPSEWNKSFAAPLSCNDPGEKPADGSLLVAPHGKGHFVYTGLSFFRQLPAGVPGAYRLLANLISL